MVEGLPRAVEVPGSTLALSVGPCPGGVQAVVRPLRVRRGPERAARADGRAPAPARAAAPLTEWACVACTYINAAGSRACEMCALAPPPPPDASLARAERPHGGGASPPVVDVREPGADAMARWRGQPHHDVTSDVIAGGWRNFGHAGAAADAVDQLRHAAVAADAMAEARGAAAATAVLGTTITVRPVFDASVTAHPAHASAWAAFRTAAALWSVDADCALVRHAMARGGTGALAGGSDWRALAPRAEDARALGADLAAVMASADGAAACAARFALMQRFNELLVRARVPRAA